MSRSITSSLTLVASLFLASSASAQQAPAAAAPTQPASSAPTANGEFVAPLQQQTQPSYVPQSVALSGPATIGDYEEGAPMPAGYHPERRTRRGLVIGGAVTFGTLYLVSAMSAAIAADTTSYQCADGSYPYGSTANCRRASNPLAALYAPVVGPFIQMGSTDSSTGRMFLAIDGAAQAAGAAMFIYGLASPKTVLVRNDLGSVRVVPQVAKGSSGVALVGEF